MSRLGVVRGCQSLSHPRLHSMAHVPCYCNTNRYCTFGNKPRCFSSHEMQRFESRPLRSALSESAHFNSSKTIQPLEPGGDRGSRHTTSIKALPTVSPASRSSLFESSRSRDSIPAYCLNVMRWRASSCTLPSCPRHALGQSKIKISLLIRQTNPQALQGVGPGPNHDPTKSIEYIFLVV